MIVPSDVFIVATRRSENTEWPKIRCKNIAGETATYSPVWYVPLANPHASCETINDDVEPPSKEKEKRDRPGRWVKIRPCSLSAVVTITIVTVKL